MPRDNEKGVVKTHLLGAQSRAPTVIHNGNGFYAQRPVRKPGENFISVIDHFVELEIVHTASGKLGSSWPVIGLPKSRSTGNPF